MANLFHVDRDNDEITVGSAATAVTISRKLTSGSFGSPLDVTNTRQYGYEIHYSGNNYNVTGIRSRAQLVTTDTTATALGGLFQGANNDNIDAGVVMGLMAEAIGKSTSNASTISTMRGALVGTEWGALDTVTNLKTLHIRGHSLNAAGAGSFGTGYGLYIENEAVGGNGQAYDAGIYFKGTNLSGGNSAYTYGIDFSGATYGTAELILSNGETISNLVDGRIDITGGLTVGDGGTTDYLQVDSDGDARFIGGAGLPFGSCYGNEIGWTQASAVQNTWYEISDSDMADGQLHDVAHDGSGKLTVTYAGMYLCTWTMSGETDGGAGTHIQATFSVNGTETNDGINHTETRGADAQIAMAGTAILDLAASATLEVSMRTTDAGTPDISVDHLNIICLQIGGT
jgi:hypothetical protein